MPNKLTEKSFTTIQFITQYWWVHDLAHSVSIIGTTLYLFGGENVARIPIDSSIYSMEISENSPNFGIWNKIQVSNKVEPVPRIAHR